MADVAGHDLVIASGHGVHLRSEAGDDYLDATAALWYCNVGHGRASIAEAVMAQMTQIASYSNFGDLATRPTLHLADRLSSLAPMADAKVFFTSGGSDAVDTAVKLVRRYWSSLGLPDRTTIITRTKSYHGMHLAGTSLAGIELNREGHGPLDTAAMTVPWDDAEALARAIDSVGADRARCSSASRSSARAACTRRRTGYLDAVRAVCRERGCPVRRRRGHHRIRTHRTDVRVGGAPSSTSC